MLCYEDSREEAKEGDKNPPGRSRVVGPAARQNPATRSAAPRPRRSMTDTDEPTDHMTDAMSSLETTGLPAVI